MRNWSKRTWLAAGLAFAFCVTITVCASRAGGARVRVQYLGDSNLVDQAFLHACFQISNGARTPVKINLERQVQDYDGTWKTVSWRWGRPGGDDLNLEPEQTHLYFVRYPEGDRACRAFVGWYQPHTRWGRRRAQWAEWLASHRFNTAAKLIGPRSEFGEIRSEEKRNSPKKGQGAD